MRNNEPKVSPATLIQLEPLVNNHSRKRPRPHFGALTSVFLCFNLFKRPLDVRFDLYFAVCSPDNATQSIRRTFSESIGLLLYTHKQNDTFGLSKRYQANFARAALQIFFWLFFEALHKNFEKVDPIF